MEGHGRNGVILQVTKTGIIIDSSKQSQLLAYVFFLFSIIELSFISGRTQADLNPAKLNGKVLV